MEGVELAVDAHKASTSQSGGSSQESLASVIVIGMRGSGKTFVGTVASDAMNWPFIDADAYFEVKHSLGVREFVQQNGWPAFRQAETEILRALLKDHPTKHIISLGGGVVETLEARELLIEYKTRAGPVVHMVRSLDEVVSYLGAENARPAYGEPIEDVYRRRAPWFKECCSHQFTNHVGEHTVQIVGEPALKRATLNEVERFFKHVTGQAVNEATNVEPGKHSYFLCLTFPDVSDVLPILDELSAGVDALELRVDLLRAPEDSSSSSSSSEGYIPPLEYVADQVAALRRGTRLPIIFTVRSAAQGGSFPDGHEKEAIQLLNLAVCLGVEYIDVELPLMQYKEVQELVRRKGRSKIIASWHDWSGNMKWTGSEVITKYSLAAAFGDIVKIVGKAESIQDNLDLLRFVNKVNAGLLPGGSRPIVAINMGTLGQMSRILNEVFTPITHPLLPSKSAPGQLSFAQIQQARHLLGHLPSLKFFIFGTPIAHSMSPTLHNTAFEALGLPHRYSPFETENVDDKIKEIITAPDFGGASVTVPFKLDIIPLLDQLSPAALAMGAVNTIVPRGSGNKRILYGDNTDWIALKACIQETVLPSASASSSIPAALVIGAGGASRASIYALQSLGVPIIYLYNRTRSTAQAVVDAFPHSQIEILDEVDKWSGPSPSVIISTVPAYVTARPSDADVTQKLVLPEKLFEYSEGRAVVIDMAYKPAETPLLKLAKEKAGKNWERVPGVSILLLQAYVQFEHWTGRRCPRGVVEKTVWQKFNAS